MNDPAFHAVITVQPTSRLTLLPRVCSVFTQMGFAFPAQSMDSPFLRESPSKCLAGRIYRIGSFTLIELLVVIAIIALLAAILLPSLGSAKQRAQQAKCLAHIKQAGLGCIMMADDNNGWLDPRNFDAPTNIYWRVALIPYIGGKIDLVNDSKKTKTSCPTLVTGSWGSTVYGINGNFGRNDIDETNLVQISRAKRPALMMLIADLYWPWTTTISNFRATCFSGNGTGSKPRHEARGLNFFFIDGHAAFLRYKQYDSVDTTGHASDWWPAPQGPWPGQIIGIKANGDFN